MGRPYDTARLRRRPLGRATALPVFSANALSSTAYAPDEILMTLALGGVALLALGPQIGLAVVAVMLLIVLSYRVSVRAYPRGGDYRIASSNLGPRAGVTVAAALMLDLVFTVAVSVAALAQYLSALVPALDGHRLWIAGGAIVLLTLANVRGAGRGRRGTAVLVYLFVAGMVTMIGAGLVQDGAGTLDPAASAGLTVVPDAAFASGVGALALGMLVLRAFSSGSALATGVEVPASNAPAMARPRTATARFVMLVLGLLVAVITLGVMHLAARTGVVVALDPAALRQADGSALPEGYVQHPVLAQLARAVFGEGTVPAIVLIGSVVVLLVIAGQSAFSSFPDLVSRLATEGYLPRQLATRGDRLAFTGSVLLLGLSALVLVAVFQAQTALLVQLYVIGVFLAFTLSQLGMVRHWRRTLVTTPGRSARMAVRTRLTVNALGFLVSAVVALVVLTTRFVQGAWVALLAIGLLVLVMTRVRGHYASVSQELEIAAEEDARALPSRVHALILVSTVHRPTLRALAYARASRPSSLEAVVVDLDPDRTQELLSQWRRLGVDVPVTVLASPYREVIAPLIRHLRALRRASPRDLVVVYIPEYVVAPGWHTLLHNRTAARIKQRLHREPGVMVTSVPWQLREALEDLEHDDGPRPSAPRSPRRGSAEQ